MVSRAAACNVSRFREHATDYGRVFHLYKEEMEVHVSVSICTSHLMYTMV